MTRSDLEHDLGHMYTVQEVADYLRCGPDKVRGVLIRKGFLPAIVNGRDYLIQSCDLMAYLDAHRTDKGCALST